MVDVQTISVLIAAASVVIAAATLTQQGWEAMRIRQDELFMPIYARFQEMEFMKPLDNIMSNWEWGDFNDYLEKYGLSKNLEADAGLAIVQLFFHCVVVLRARALTQAERSMVEAMFLCLKFSGY